MDAWQVYLDEFRRRAGPDHAQRFSRQERLTEAAHDAYQAAADLMIRQHGWRDEHTLVVMRGFNAGVKQWLATGSGDWDALARELRRREEEVRNGFGDDRTAT
jgi:hypothetical protein